MTEWYEIADEDERQAAWARGDTFGLVRDLTTARKTIRRLDPALGMVLDVVMPLPLCRHEKRSQVRTDYGKLPEWVCRGCGVDMTDRPRLRRTR